MTQALSIQQRSVPQVVGGRCVLTVDQPPPCPSCDGRGKWPDKGAAYSVTGWSHRWQMAGCFDCNGSGQAPPGTEITVWHDGHCESCGGSGFYGAGAVCDCSGGYDRPAAVVLAGKLAEAEKVVLTDQEHDAGYDDHFHVTLVDVVMLPQPISEWWEPATSGFAQRRGVDAFKESVASLGESWSVAPQALVDAIKEAT